jgi:hypothetical protein
LYKVGRRCRGGKRLFRRGGGIAFGGKKQVASSIWRFLTLQDKAVLKTQQKDERLNSGHICMETPTSSYRRSFSGGAVKSLKSQMVIDQG